MTRAAALPLPGAGGRRPRIRPRTARSAVVGLGVAAALGAASMTSPAHAAAASRHAWTWSLPRNFPDPMVLASNPMTKAKVDLGRYLFYDTRLSGNGTQSCGSCHLQSLAFTDGRVQSVGSTGDLTPRSAPSLANVVYNATLTWANPSLVSLEMQMAVPLFGERPVEMGVTDANRGAILRRISRDRRYRTRFRVAFPGARSPISWGNITKAIASFQRTLISGDSRYDRYLQGRARLTDSETRGMNLFFGEKAECFHCHTGFTFSDQVVYAGLRDVERPFHNTGLYNVGGTGAFPEPNRGVFDLTGTPTDMGAFRAPTLRNVEVTAPYMHDGSITTLQDVVNFYANGGRDITQGPNAGDGRVNPFKDGLISNIDLDAADRADLVAFLRTLTDRGFLTRRSISDPFATRGQRRG